MRYSLFVLCLFILIPVHALQATDRTELTVMSFNIWGGGTNAKKPVDETVAAIRAANPDIIGILETVPEPDPCTAESCDPKGPSVAKDIAEKLGYFYYDQGKRNVALWSGAILSRYPIGKASESDLGVEIDVMGRKVWAFCVHLTDFPYQPYQLLNIPYGTAPFLKSAEEAVVSAKSARGPALDLLSKVLKPHSFLAILMSHLISIGQRPQLLQAITPWRWSGRRRNA